MTVYAVDLNIECLIKAPWKPCIIEYQLLGARQEKDKRTASDTAELLRVFLLTLCCKWTDRLKGRLKCAGCADFYWKSFSHLFPKGFCPSTREALWPVRDQPFLSVRIHLTTKRVKGYKRTQQLVHSESVEDCYHFWDLAKRGFFGHCNLHWKDRTGRQ